MQLSRLPRAVGIGLARLLTRCLRLLGGEGGRVRSYILEGDSALDVFARKDGLVVPANEDSNVAWQFWWHLER